MKTFWYKRLTGLLLLLALVSCSYAQHNNKILVLSGGGARGAWGGGVIQGLRSKNITFNKVIGTSTGTLLAPLTLLGGRNSKYIDTLKTAYENVTQSSIFNVNPFKQSGPKKGQPKMLLAIFRILFNKETLGESKNLLKRIQTFYSAADHELIRKDSMEFIATVLNVDLSEVEYKSSKIYNYNQMVNWMWASANEPVFMSLYQNDSNKYHYVDGGVKETLPIKHAIELAYKNFKDDNQRNDIDSIYIIINNDTSQQDVWDRQGKSINILNSLLRTLDVLKLDTREKNIEIGKLMADLSEFGVVVSENDKVKFHRHHRGEDEKHKLIKLIIYSMQPEDVATAENELMFDPTIMNNLWTKGVQAATTANYQKKFEYDFMMKLE